MISGKGMIPRLLPDGLWRFKNSGLPTARWLVHRESRSFPYTYSERLK
jgi:hypothetical protein